ncbi:MAG: RNA methyltransferase [Caulobacterales bacterium]|nr:RNA methyltransferase [Caulobacterales bacterium]
MPILRLSDPLDPRIEAYRDIRERDLAGRQGLFVAEGEVVLGHLIGPRSRFEVDSVLVADSRLEGLEMRLRSLQAPVFVASQVVMDAIAGFPIHRGILAMGRRGEPASLSELPAMPAPTDMVLAAVGIGNHDNMGGLFRAAAAFGARAVVLDSTCCDPLYRKAIRVSVGASLIQPFVRLQPGEDMVTALARAGYACWALTPSGGEMLSHAESAGATALIVGSEGLGLPQAMLARCRGIAIPMADGFDSLNVATAAAIALHHLAR